MTKQVLPRGFTFAGRHHSEATKQKLSRALMGHPGHGVAWARVDVECQHCGQVFSANRSAKRKYCSHSCASKEGNFKNGSKLYLDKLPRGAAHYQWKGGATPARRVIYTSAPYKEWRKAVFVRDDYTCQQCSVRGVPIHADHIIPWSLKPDLVFVLENGRTLCIPCHRATPTYGIKLFNALRGH